MISIIIISLMVGSVKCIKYQGWCVREIFKLVTENNCGEVYDVKLFSVLVLSISSFTLKKNEFVFVISHSLGNLKFQ